jgi:hypothetical protein
VKRTAGRLSERHGPTGDDTVAVGAPPWVPGSGSRRDQNGVPEGACSVCPAVCWISRGPAEPGLFCELRSPGRVERSQLGGGRAVGYWALP